MSGRPHSSNSLKDSHLNVSLNWSNGNADDCKSDIDYHSTLIRLNKQLLNRNWHFDGPALKRNINIVSQ